LAQIVTQALTALPEDLRAVVVLRHYQGLSFEEIAHVTRTPASTLKSRFTMAMAKLRRWLERFHLDQEMP